MTLVRIVEREVQRDAQRCPTCRLLPGRCRCWTPDERPNPFRQVITICRTCTEEQDSKVSLSDCVCWERLLPERRAS